MSADNVAQPPPTTSCRAYRWQKATQVWLSRRSVPPAGHRNQFEVKSVRFLGGGHQRWSSGWGYLACWSLPRCAPRQVGLITQHIMMHVFYQESSLYGRQQTVWLKNYNGFVKTRKINITVFFMLKVSFSRPKDGNCDKLVFFNEDQGFQTVYSHFLTIKLTWKCFYTINNLVALVATKDFKKSGQTLWI